MALNLEIICEKLRVTDRQIKLDTLNELKAFCESADNSVPVIQDTFDACYLHVLKCYSDRFENVRELAVQCVMAFMTRVPANDFHLFNIIGTLTQRMGQHETIEESEEVRLIYVEQLHKLVVQYITCGNKKALEQCYADITQILIKSIRDSYPAVQREACACVVALARVADSYEFQAYAEQMLPALYHMLNHKHSTGRMAAVEALGRLALHINANSESLTRMLMEVSPLLMDSMPLVRRECGQMGALLLLELRDRYSFFERIIPLVLCCLKDECAEVREHILPLWLQCGKQYYDENELELNKQEIADCKASNYPTGVQRPTIGCRALVQRSLRLINVIARESSDWKENVRLHSMKLMYQFVLHAEAAMTAKFFEIYPDLARCCQDADAEVQNEAFKVADLMGRLMSYYEWFDHGFEGFEKNAKSGYLKCFYYMFSATDQDDFEHIAQICNVLVTPDFSQSLKPEFQKYILKMLHTMLEKLQRVISQQHAVEALEKAYESIYIICIKVLALAFNNDNCNFELTNANAMAILTNIAAAKACTVDELHELYLNAALKYVQNLDAHLDAQSEPVLLLHGLISICKFRAAYLSEMQNKINEVFDNCADESKVKIFSAISIAMLDWNKTIDNNDSCKLLENFVESVVEAHLGWRAGANAEAMRTLATATLAAISQGAVSEARTVLPKMCKYMSNLLEDQAVATRRYAVKCMFNFGDLKIEQLKPLAYGTLQRLDDPSADIRELAVLAIPKLSPLFENDEQGEFDKGIWHAFIDKAVGMLLLHYEGPEVRLKSAIKCALLELLPNYKDICKNCFERTIAMTYNSGSILQQLKIELQLD